MPDGKIARGSAEVEQSGQRPRIGVTCAAIMLGLALLLGGGGSPAPLPELALQVTTGLIFCWWLLRNPAGVALVPQAAWWIVALPTALHLAQLIPLPPGVWQSLPGRSAQLAALELVQAENSWRPLTLSPARTLASLLCLLSALALLLIASTLAAISRWWLIAILAIAGAVTVIIGMAQIIGAPGNPFRFFSPAQTWLTGFQANRNSTADLLLIAMLALATVAWKLQQPGHAQLSPALIGAGLFACTMVLALALFLTGSRTGLLLLPPVLLMQFIIVKTGRCVGLVRPAAATAIIAAVVAGALTLLRDNRMIGAVLARFTLDGEFRPELWRDSLFALDQTWPAGSGQGTFVPVMIAAERLEVIDTTLPNRAHNDFLELAIEGGLPALFAFAAIAAILTRAAWHCLHERDPCVRVQARFAASTLCVLMLHSLVDYPLRSMALAAVAAIAAGILFPAKAKGGGRPGSR